MEKRYRFVRRRQECGSTKSNVDVEGEKLLDGGREAVRGGDSESGSRGLDGGVKIVVQ